MESTELLFKTMRMLTNYTRQYTDRQSCLLLQCKSGDTLLLGRKEQEGGALMCSHEGEKSLSKVLEKKTSVCFH